MKPSERLDQMLDEYITEAWKALGNRQIPRDGVARKMMADHLTYWEVLKRFFDERVKPKS